MKKLIILLLMIFTYQGFTQNTHLIKYNFGTGYIVSGGDNISSQFVIGQSFTSVQSSTDKNLFLGFLTPVLPDPNSVEIKNDDNLLLNVYPIPASDNITISFNQDIKGRFRISIFDLIGILIYEDVVSIDSDNKVTIKTSLFKSGMYHILLSNQSISYSEKFIIY